MHPSPDVLALLALGEEAGTPEERAHIDSCDQCRAEIADLGRVVTAGRGARAEETALVDPPDRVWQAVRAELGLAPETARDDPQSAPGRSDVSPLSALPRTERAASNGGRGPDQPSSGDATPTREVASLDDARSRSSRGRRGLALLVAAAVALVLGVGLGFGLDRMLQPRPTVLWTANLQALPDFAGSTGEAEVVEDANGNRTLVLQLHSPEPVEGSRAVWLIDPDAPQQMRIIGSLNSNGDGGSWPVPADVDPRQYPIVDVSKEPPGDLDLRHSGTSIVRGALNV